MRKILLSAVLAVSLVLSLSGIAFAGTPNWFRDNYPESQYGTPSPETLSKRWAKITELTTDPDGPTGPAKPILPPDASGRALNLDISVKYGMPIYGGPYSIPEGSYPSGFALATQKWEDSNHEPRYLGYTVFGDPITNMWFEPDSQWSRDHTTPFNPPIDDWDNSSGVAINPNGLNLRNWVEVFQGDTTPPTTWNIWDEWTTGYKEIDTVDVDPGVVDSFNRVFVNLTPKNAKN